MLTSLLMADFASRITLKFFTSLKHNTSNKVEKQILIKNRTSLLVESSSKKVTSFQVNKVK